MWYTFKMPILDVMHMFTPLGSRTFQLPLCGVHYVVDYKIELITVAAVGGCALAGVIIFMILFIRQRFWTAKKPIRIEPVDSQSGQLCLNCFTISSSLQLLAMHIVL